MNSPLVNIHTTVADVYHRLAQRCYDAGRREDFDEVARFARLTDVLEAIVQAVGLMAQDDSTPPTSSST